MKVARAIRVGLAATLVFALSGAWVRVAPAYRPGPPAVILDGLGRPVGPLRGILDAQVAVLLRIVGDRTVALAVTRDRFVTGLVPAYYESGDCSGAPLLRAFPGPLVPSTEWVVLGPGPVLLAPDGPAQNKTVHSTWTEGPVSGFCTPDPAGQALDVHPTTVILDLATIPGPFVLR